MLISIFLWLLVGRAVGQSSTQGLTTTILSSSTENPNTGIKGCSACYGVAPIDQIITGVGGSFSLGLGQFTWNLAEVFSAQTDTISLAALPTAPVITFHNFPIGNPSIYNVFTSFQIIALHEPSGFCTSTTLSVAELELPLSLQIPSQIPSGAISEIIPQAESSFISYFNSLYGSLACVTLSDGVVISTTDLFTTTVTSFTTAPSRPHDTAVTLTLNISTPSTSVSSQSSGIFLSSSATPTGNSSSATPVVSSDNTDLSQAAKIGIGIGVGVGGAIILIIIGMILWKRRIRKTQSIRDSYTTAELSSKELKSQIEVDNNIAPQELQNNGPPQELPSYEPPELR